MKYKLCLLMLCAGAQGSVQAEGGFFSRMKDKAFGWWGSKNNQAESQKELSVEDRVKTSIDIMMKDLTSVKATDSIKKLCEKFPDTQACKEAAIRDPEVKKAMENGSGNNVQLKEINDETTAEVLLKQAGDDEGARHRVCKKYPNTAVCKKREEDNAALMKTFKALKSSVTNHRATSFSKLEKEARIVAEESEPSKELCRLNPEFQERLHALFPQRAIFCKDYIQALKVQLLNQKYN
jgi:hypothetical protein